MNYCLEDTALSKLDTMDSKSLDGPITKEECIAAIKAMSSHKSPGLDGLTKEFYSSVFYLIGDSFVEMINICLRNGCLSISQRMGLITLICKDPARSTDLTNWRPISLLNCDYKIVSKVLCMRLRNVISSVISIDQTCSVVGRSILDNLHLIRNIVDYVNDKNLNTAILCLDQSKAFDRVSHRYLFTVLKAFGFGENFISWIRLLYNDINSSVLVNGRVSSPFSVRRSVRQGCSLSPLLYILCIEPFAHKIRRDVNIRGLHLPGTHDEARISQYADDTNIIVRDRASIDRVFWLVELYGLASGSKLNKEKSWGIWLGGWRNCQDKPAGINWTNMSKKLCGLFLGNEDTIEQNWKCRLKKVKTAITIHSGRALSMRGKSVVIQSVICSKIWCIGSVLNLPTRLARRLQYLIFRFVWSEKPESVARTTMYSGYAKGGMSIVNIAVKIDSFHVFHLYRLLKGHCAKWSFFAIYWLGLKLRHFVPLYGSNLIPHSFKCPSFYKTAVYKFEAFAKLVPDLMVRNDITVKFIYNIFMEHIISPPIVVRKYPSIAFDVNVWPNIHNNLVDGNLRDLAWRVAHNILPTNDLLYRRRIRKSFICPLCSMQRETIAHLFIECPVVRPVWDFMQYLARAFSDSDVVFTRQTVLFNVFKDKHTKYRIALFFI